MMKILKKILQAEGKSYQNLKCSQRNEVSKNMLNVFLLLSIRENLLFKAGASKLWLTG